MLNMNGQNLGGSSSLYTGGDGETDGTPRVHRTIEDSDDQNNGFHHEKMTDIKKQID
jgi:hypothetical protein